jgi:hypothetical protein
MRINEIDPITTKQIDRINKLTNDITALNDFIAQLDKHKNDQLLALYIVTDSIRIELKDRFSSNATEKLFDLILESRHALSLALVDLLKDLSDQLKD